jgi:hypothetical protein
MLCLPCVIDFSSRRWQFSFVGHEIVAVISRRRLFLLLLLLPIFESMDPSARKKRKKLKWKSIAEEHNYWTAVRENNSENVRTGGGGSGSYGRINGSIVTTRHTTELNIKSIKLQTVPPLLCRCETFFGGKRNNVVAFFLFF